MLHTSVCLSVCLPVREWQQSWWEADPTTAYPSIRPAPGEGKEAWRGTRYCSAPANARGTQDKQEGELRFPVFVLQIFSLRRFFLILSPGLFASNKGKESPDCRHPLGPHYFPIITAAGRTRGAILLLQTLHFHLSFTLFSPHSTPTSPHQAPSPATGAEMGLGAQNCSRAESMWMFDVTQQLEAKISRVRSARKHFACLHNGCVCLLCGGLTPSPFRRR